MYAWTFTSAVQATTQIAMIPLWLYLPILILRFHLHLQRTGRESAAAL
jgi:hypothetical protein